MERILVFTVRLKELSTVDRSSPSKMTLRMFDRNFV